MSVKTKKEKEVFNISKNHTDIISILQLTTKTITVIIFALIMMLMLTIILYRPSYEVSYEGEKVGYIIDKNNFETKLNSFLEQNNDEIAYVHIDSLPNYSFTLTKRTKEVDDNMVYNMVISNALVYNRVYAINVEENEIAIVKTSEEAKELVDELKTNVKNSSINYEISEAHLVNPVYSTTEEVVALAKDTYTEKTLSKVSTSNVKVESIQVAFANPARGTITSRYGYRSSEFHTGIDIANPLGTPIYAAADGIVKFAGTRGTYGNLVIIEHEDNMITYYAHCDKLYVQEGENVKQGMQIATIGLTGRTTGPHLHFEVRVNNETVNPQSYVKNIGM